MGYEIAGGLGVAMAEPDRRVFVMVGDGSYLMLANEILTACQEGISMTIVLLDNHGYRCIRNLSAACGGDNPFNDFRVRDPASGTFTGEVLPIDFAANAASLGARVLTADTPAELEACPGRRRTACRAVPWSSSSRSNPSRRCPTTTVLVGRARGRGLDVRSASRRRVAHYEAQPGPRALLRLGARVAPRLITAMEGGLS